ncbi:ubiquitin carboxyl-terminal hydrolase family protein, putative [Ichthyophthirius multifiliis]|uniref:Ubiquitin carboxyl-terminal hydrolase family protein, putative n=1 Tax=Ichthyophthirius multifiliis TaxID=5932 RepID=G0QV32_ICHMU|nr:ubiquitin carboxyl-terminal hydrolase family protein, putative [Ichthyophthirius multifiliis]EGR30925.1 ubiquitin carboxyl-terminal hydrolase family protein, putative [Ichthyophthirius multifiliis]|eukprot:XP_004032512.1 ubiquitin carboxyl-terminal hydrolase family protein, putative [Ichthyophthirius multifiliis]
MNKYLIIQLNIFIFSNKDLIIKDQEIYHLSNWIYFEKKKDNLLYQFCIQNKGRLPIRLNIFYKGKLNQIMVYNDSLLKELKQKLSDEFSIESNKIYLTTHNIKQDLNDFSIDDQQLQFLKIIDEYEIILQELDQQYQDNSKQKVAKQQEKQEQQIIQGLVSILVQNSDENGINRLFIDYKSMNLQQLFDYLKEQFKAQDQQRRLRKLENNQLYYQNEYCLSLEELGYAEGGVRLQFERGEIPVSGNIPIKIINQSSYSQQNKFNTIEVILSVDKTIEDIKIFACQQLNLEPNNHKLYKTDWLEDPIQLLNNEKQIIRNSMFKQQEVLVLRDILSPISKEFKKFSIFLCQSQDIYDLKSVGDIKLKEDESIKQLKEMIMSIPDNYKYLRIMDIKKDSTLGQIHKENDKQVKKCIFSTNNIAVQILDNEDTLKTNDILLHLKKRNCMKREYENTNIEIILSFQKQQVLTVEFLKQIIAEKIKLGENQFDIAKYFNYEFQWQEIKQEIQESQDNSNNNKSKSLKQINLKKPPYLIKDQGFYIQSFIFNIIKIRYNFLQNKIRKSWQQ